MWRHSPPATMRRSDAASGLRRCAHVWLSAAGAEQVLEEECREVVTPREAGLAVDRARLLTDRRLAHLAYAGDLLVAQALEEQARDLLLGRCELPPLELAIDRRAEPRDQI